MFGYDVPLSILEAVTELSQDELRDALKRLQASEFLYETHLFPDIEFAFKHALLHDVAYQMLSAGRRRQLHAAALIAGEEIFADQLNEKADWLAFRLSRGSLG